MNAAAKPTGLDVGSTRPLSRAERREQAARIEAERLAAAQASEPEEEVAAPGDSQEQTPAEQPEPKPAPKAKSTRTATPTITLQARKKPAKRPFATQLKPSTLGRLEWIRTRGYVITDTVDDAINAYLDAAGIPQADDHGNVPD